MSWRCYCVLLADAHQQGGESGKVHMAPGSSSTAAVTGVVTAAVAVAIAAVAVAATPVVTAAGAASMGAGYAGIACMQARFLVV